MVRFVFVASVMTKSFQFVKVHFNLRLRLRLFKQLLLMERLIPFSGHFVIIVCLRNELALVQIVKETA